ncbi:NAD-dependent epimerase/dehydratase family protein [Synechococcus sp. UW105]|uniref:NAD-dependent epimerase/dehydratase family protein n=1 Tax=Synechococcus sp. UW105 TaxID=337067 RepID=UPI000E0E779E|nr:NAD-dependent epimerase/dehydratase family protein [Synechococcus sp. UW105]
MRILLTGGSGLVGSNILEISGNHSHEILAPRRTDLDLTQYSSVLKYISDCKPDIVVHAAGRVGGIQANIASPVDFLVQNIDIGKNIILASHSLGINRFLNIGSSCMYPKGRQDPLTEDMILAGELEPTNEGYALAKIMCQRLCQYISRDPNYQYKTIIPCNIYGRYDSFLPPKSHLIPAIIYKIHKAVQSGVQNIEIWGDGLAKREFMYATDLANCIFECIDRYDSLPPLMNIGLSEDFTINHYYEVAAEIIGFDGFFVHNTDMPVGMRRKKVSTNKQIAWGWRPMFSLNDGIKLTYEYFLSTING